ncbi:MAG: O-antigen ligase family protein [Chromatiales bacterium]|nr:O-antigen ligase family protein [Chromatiales bacterium]
MDNIISYFSSEKGRLWLKVLLLSLPIILLPVSRSSEVPIAILAILGGNLFWQKRAVLFQQSAYRNYSLLFLAIWLPMLLSIFDSIYLYKSVKTSIGYIRFYFAGIYVIYLLMQPMVRTLTMRLLIGVVLFWLVNACVQLVIGHDLFGQTYIHGRLNGVFGDNLKQGQVLAVLGAVLLVWTRKELGSVGHVAFAVLLLAIILLSGTRESWVMVLVAMVGFWLYAYRQRLRSGFRLVVPLLLVCGFLLVGLYQWSSDFRLRVDQTLYIADGDHASIDKALSYRLSIWEHAYEVMLEHPINGVGARTFRKIYDEYAGGDNFFISRNLQVAHAHQLLLEVGSGTGVIGLLGLGFFYYLFARSWRECSDEAR